VHLALLPAVVLDARRFFWQPLGEVFLRRPKVRLIPFCTTSSIPICLISFRKLVIGSTKAVAVGVPPPAPPV